MAFNPEELEAYGRAQVIGNQSGDSDTSQAPTVQAYKSSDGTVYQAVLGQDGKPAFYTTDAGDNKYERHFQDKDGTWISEVKEKQSWNPIRDVLADEKLMTFIAIASAGAAASAYAGAGAGAGTSGMSAGEIAALEAGDVAIGGGGVASNTVSSAVPGILESGAIATPVTQGAIEVGAAAAPGAVTPAASTAASSAVDASWFVNSATDAAAYEGMTNGLASSSNYFSQALGWAAKNPQIAGGIISGIGQAYAAHQRGGGKGDEMALLNRKIEAESAEAERQRAHAGRNFQGSSYAKIDWGERPNLTTEMPVMRNTGPTPQNALNTKTSQLGVLERRRRDGR